MLIQEAHRHHVEEARDIIGAAAALLPAGKACRLPLDADLEVSDSALSATRRLLTRMARPDDDRGAVRARVSDLVFESAATQAKLKDARIEQRAEMTSGVREALSAMRNATSVAALAEYAPMGTQRMGFRRALYSQIERGTWLAESAFSASAPDCAAELIAIGKANPRRLNGPLVESEMVRRCVPVVISDPQTNPHVHLPMVRHSDTTSYVAAPIIAWGVPVAMVHADRETDGVVDELDRYMLGVYAEGLGLALERTQLMERMQAVREATTAYMSGMGAIVDGFTSDVPGSVQRDLEAGWERESRTALLADRNGGRLTPREWDVLRYMASGKTNGQIATGLFVTEGTVKSHVKHILRKLAATNRTEAVARYHALAQTSVGARVG